ncbi:hypothetical protein G6F69_008927 [Rhizopus microsporus]|nr:hypothetical protein G6F69_008927 [Rhizopus microsporus]
MDVKLVETVGSNGRAKVLTNVVKRRRTGAPPLVEPSGAPMDSQGNVVGTPAVSGGGVPPIRLPPIVTGPVASTVTPTVINDGMKTPDKPKKKRGPPRKLAVPTRKIDVWGMLARTDSGLSMLDALVLNRDLRKDVVDGVRFLNQRRKKKDTHSEKAPMVIDSVLTMDSDLYDSEGESGFASDETYSTDGDSSYLDDDELSSVYRYPYSLDKMKAGTPLRGHVSINGIVVDCVFDSGASVSVISKTLADRIGLIPSGDTLELSGFDNRGATTLSQVVMDVPVMISGCLRPEHMCVVDLDNSGHKEDELCILGVPWFKAYGIQPVIENGAIRIPTSRGIVNHTCYTTRKSVVDSVVSKKNKKVNFLLPVNDAGGLPTIEEMAQRLEDNSAEVYTVVTSLRNDGSVFKKETDVLNSKQLRQKASDLVESYEEGIHGNLMESDGEDADGDEVPLPEAIRTLVEEDFVDCFVENAGLGRVKGFTHTIELLPNSKPVRSVPFRLTWEENDYLQKEIKEMLELGIIRPSKTGTFSSPCFFVKKKDGSRRIVIDYRNLNRITVPSAHPLPLISELLDSLGGARYFTTMDLASGYWQVPMDEESIEKTGFVTKQGIYEFLVMPFGLCTAPARFQSMMNEILQEYIGAFCLVFIDDVLVYGGETIEEHAVLVSKVLQKCKDANLKLKKKKCSWAKSEVEYLGHKVTADGLLPGDHNIKKVLEFKVPTNGSEVKSFLGLCSYYRAFCKDFATHAEPLQGLVKKNALFVWGTEHERSFRHFQKVLTSPPLLAYPNREKVQVLTVDASLHGLGAILSQVSNLDNLQDEEVVSYASRTLRGAEKNYAITHVEALAVVWAVQYYRHFLLGRKFLLVSDHSALKYIFNPSKKTPKLTRWAGTLMEYDYQLIYRKGENNPADALSRLVQNKNNEETGDTN